MDLITTAPKPLSVPVLVSENDYLGLPTPVNWKVLSNLLHGYDKEISEYLCSGFHQGFQLNFQGFRDSSDSPNLKSALEFPEIVTAKISKELEAGRIAGPFKEKPFANFKISPIGVVPKKEPGEYRMIHHLSYPRNSGNSVNENIPSEFTRVSYETVDTAVSIINQLGRGAYMSKTDIQSAFRIIPVHPDDYPLLGFKWEGNFYFDKCLPMGAASSCQIFETFSTALKWIAQTKYGIQNIVKILDDFLFLAPSYSHAADALSFFKEMCSKLGVPLNAQKTFEPSQVMDFLGITLDSIKMESRLPPDKIAKLNSLLIDLQPKPCCSLRDLLSVIGLLNFACSVIRPGRAFLRRLIDLSIGVKHLHYKVRLKLGAKEDMLTWLRFLEHYNSATFFIHEKSLTSAEISLQTDAAGSLGYGAIYNTKWFFGAFPPSWRKANISFLELYPIVAAVYTWGHLWKNHRVIFLTDNEALVPIINKQTSKVSCIMFLIRKLVFHCLKQNIEFRATHVQGKHNVLADALSRFQLQKFRTAAPHCDQNPTSLSREILPNNFCKELKL